MTNPEQPLIDAVTQIRNMIHLPEQIERMLDDAMAKCPELVIAGYEGCAGLYYTRQLAVANGEQKIEPVYRVKS